ncbi:hypothetical protein [Nocardioides sp. 1609]|uniref:dual OB domain-containing protein n=1 Tax=Nocardioides sp. 1609 TaxID=2508327 RepID=UPI00107041A3|nr:hypothetical protein [Nocardioides sp. 1609]
MELTSVVCLANSKKQGGNCFAGIELDDGWPAGWVRPIGRGSGHGVSVRERQLADGREPRPLDVISIALSGPAPWGHQGENWDLDPSVAWEKIGTWAYDDLDALVDPPDALWTDAESSSVGTRDRVPVECLVPAGESIHLIRPGQAELRVARNPYSRTGEIEVRVSFEYAEAHHLIKVSDPIYKDWYLREGIGTYELPETYLTVSLAEPWAHTPGDPQYSYIVAAAIIEPDGLPGASR